MHLLNLTSNKQEKESSTKANRQMEEHKLAVTLWQKKVAQIPSSREQSNLTKMLKSNG